MSQTEMIAEAALKVLAPLEQWHHKCHQASVALVRGGVGNRVARGVCRGVCAPHSWVTFGDQYDPQVIVDPTRWSWEEKEPAIDVCHGTVEEYVPFGKGSIWGWGCPAKGDGPEIRIQVGDSEAADFLKLVGPLDLTGWHALLAHAPLQGWPAAEIMRAACEHEDLCALIPIDRKGMLLGEPGDLYPVVTGELENIYPADNEVEMTV